MDSHECDGSTIRLLNQQMIAQDKECQKTIAEMRAVEKFLSDFGFLSFGRDFVICGRHTFSLQMISTAFELTAGSIISCCESGCMADAYSLLRKYRDDLFFYLYVVVYDSCNKLDNKSPAVTQMETNIERWINNDLDDLYIGTVLQAIGQSPKVRDAVRKYDLKSYFDDLGVRLNNYVHSNGVFFYNLNVNTFPGKTLQKQLLSLLTDMRSITIAFLFLLALCSPLSIMSTDYVDYLDCNMTPPDGSQYWVAPFISEFFKNNLDLIDESCMKYLQDNTLMEFES
ncbi:MAG: hypothetical protein IJG45_02675 [Oscillospiraceae bacterium]|nr:hypothetical protein [Oscillospiraceae bacterium]